MIHVKDSDMILLLKGKLGEDEAQEAVFHISNCDSCSQRFADLTMDMATLTPPKGMYEEVLNASAKEKSDRRKKGEILMLYSMRVVTGICAAIVLMYTGMFRRIADLDIDMSKVQNASYSISEHMHNNLNEFSDRLFNREDKAN